MVQRNGYFAHQEYALIALSGNDNENVRNVRVAKAIAHRKQVVEESANNDGCPHALNSSLIRLFDVPTLNSEALANFDSYQQKPPAIASLADTEIEEWLEKPLVLPYLHVIACLSSGASNMLRKRLHKLQDLIDEMSHSTKKLNLANLQKHLTPKNSSIKVFW